MAEAERLYVQATEHSSAGAYAAAQTSLGMASDQFDDEDSGFLGLRHLLSNSELPDTVRNRRTSLVERAVQLFHNIQRERQLIGLRVRLEAALEVAAFVEEANYLAGQRGELERYVRGPRALLELVKVQREVERLARQVGGEDLAEADALDGWNTEEGLTDLERVLVYDGEIPETAPELAVARVERDLAVLAATSPAEVPNELRAVVTLLWQREAARQVWEVEEDARFAPEKRDALTRRLEHEYHVVLEQWALKYRTFAELVVLGDLEPGSGWTGVLKATTAIEGVAGARAREETMSDLVARRELGLDELHFEAAEGLDLHVLNARIAELRRLELALRMVRLDDPAITPGTVLGDRHVQLLRERRDGELAQARDDADFLEREPVIAGLIDELSAARRQDDDPNAGRRLLTALPLAFVPSPYGPGITELGVASAVAAIGLIVVGVSAYRVFRPRLTTFDEFVVQLPVHRRPGALDDLVQADLALELPSDFIRIVERRRQRSRRVAGDEDRLDSLSVAAWLDAQAPPSSQQLALASSNVTGVLVKVLSAAMDADETPEHAAQALVEGWLHALLYTGRTPAQAAAAARDLDALRELTTNLGLTPASARRMVVDEQPLHDWIADAVLIAKERGDQQAEERLLRMWQEWQLTLESTPTVSHHVPAKRPTRIAHRSRSALSFGAGAVLASLPPLLNDVGLENAAALVAAAAGTGYYVALRRGPVLTLADFVAQLPRRRRAEALAYLDSVDRTSARPDLLALTAYEFAHAMELRRGGATAVTGHDELERLYVSAWLAAQRPLSGAERKLGSLNATEVLVLALAARSDSELDTLPVATGVDGGASGDDVQRLGRTWLHALLLAGWTPAQIVQAKWLLGARHEVHRALVLTADDLRALAELEPKERDAWIALRTQRMYPDGQEYVEQLRKMWRDLQAPAEGASAGRRGGSGATKSQAVGMSLAGLSLGASDQPVPPAVEVVAVVAGVAILATAVWLDRSMRQRKRMGALTNAAFTLDSADQDLADARSGQTGVLGIVQQEPLVRLRTAALEQYADAMLAVGPSRVRHLQSVVDSRRIAQLEEYLNEGADPARSGRLEDLVERLREMVPASGEDVRGSSYGALRVTVAPVDRRARLLNLAAQLQRRGDGRATGHSGSTRSGALTTAVLGFALGEHASTPNPWVFTAVGGLTIAVIVWRVRAVTTTRPRVDDVIRTARGLADAERAVGRRHEWTLRMTDEGLRQAIRDEQLDTEHVDSRRAIEAMSQFESWSSLWRGFLDAQARVLDELRGSTEAQWVAAHPSEETFELHLDLVVAQHGTPDMEQWDPSLLLRLTMHDQVTARLELIRAARTTAAVRATESAGDILSNLDGRQLTSSVRAARVLLIATWADAMEATAELTAAMRAVDSADSEAISELDNASERFYLVAANLHRQGEALLDALEDIERTRQQEPLIRAVLLRRALGALMETRFDQARLSEYLEDAIATRAHDLDRLRGDAQRLLVMHDRVGWALYAASGLARVDRRVVALELATEIGRATSPTRAVDRMIKHLSPAEPDSQVADVVTWLWTQRADGAAAAYARRAAAEEFAVALVIAGAPGAAALRRMDDPHVVAALRRMDHTQTVAALRDVLQARGRTRNVAGGVSRRDARVLSRDAVHRLAMLLHEARVAPEMPAPPPSERRTDGTDRGTGGSTPHVRRTSMRVVLTILFAVPWLAVLPAVLQGVLALTVAALGTVAVVRAIVTSPRRRRLTIAVAVAAVVAAGGGGNASAPAAAVGHMSGERAVTAPVLRARPPHTAEQRLPGGLTRERPDPVADARKRVEKAEKLIIEATRLVGAGDRLGATELLEQAGARLDGKAGLLGIANRLVADGFDEEVAEELWPLVDQAEALAGRAEQLRVAADLMSEPVEIRRAEKPTTERLLHPLRIENPQATRPTLQDKDMDRLVALAWEQGAWVAKTGRDGAMIFSPYEGGGIVVIRAAVGRRVNTNRATMNAKRDLRHAGFRNVGLGAAPAFLGYLGLESSNWGGIGAATPITWAVTAVAVVAIGVVIARAGRHAHRLLTFRPFEPVEPDRPAAPTSADLVQRAPGPATVTKREPAKQQPRASRKRPDPVADAERRVAEAERLLTEATRHLVAGERSSATELVEQASARLDGGKAGLLGVERRLLADGFEAEVAAALWPSLEKAEELDARAGQLRVAIDSAPAPVSAIAHRSRRASHDCTRSGSRTRMPSGRRCPIRTWIAWSLSPGTKARGRSRPESRA